MSKGHNSLRAVVAGHICLDITPGMPGIRLSRSADFFAPGTLRNVESAALSTGGTVSNTGLSLTRLGIDAVLMGKVGDDAFGGIIQSILRDRWGVTEGMIVVPGEVTSYTIVVSPPGFDRMFLHAPAANNTFVADDIRFDLVAQANLFHFGYPPLMAGMFADDGRELVKVFQQVKHLGVTTSLDMAYPDPDAPSGAVNWRKVLQDSLPYVDIFLPSAEEILYMLQPERCKLLRDTVDTSDINEQLTVPEIADLAEELLAMGVAVAGIKCGTRGVYLRTAGRERLAALKRVPNWNSDDWANRERWEPIYHVDDFVTANGSGDATIAGFLTAFLKGCSLTDALHYACAVGACNVMAADAVSGIRSWDETSHMIQSGWVKRPLVIGETGWYREVSGQWIGPNEQ